MNAVSTEAFDSVAADGSELEPGSVGGRCLAGVHQVQGRGGGDQAEEHFAQGEGDILGVWEAVHVHQLQGNVAVILAVLSRGSVGNTDRQYHSVGKSSFIN